MKKIDFNRVSALVAAVLSLCLLAGCGGRASSRPVSGPASSASQAAQPITAAVRITGRDGTVTELPLNTTQGATLAEALADAGVISEEEAANGFVTTVNGITADYSADGAWWGVVDAEGQMTPVGIGDITLSEGDVYGFVYNVG